VGRTARRTSAARSTKGQARSERTETIRSATSAARATTGIIVVPIATETANQSRPVQPMISTAYTNRPDSTAGRAVIA